MTSGKSIRFLRMWKGLTQRDMARRLGVTQPAYFKIEKLKRVKQTKVEQILKAMECNYSDLEPFINIH